MNELPPALPGEPKARGAYATPLPLARQLAASAVARAAAGRSARQIERLRILEPACGDGVMLVAAIEALESEWIRAGGDPRRRHRLRQCLARRCLHGVDIDERAVLLARARLAERCGVAPPWEHLRAGDALAGGARAGILGGGFDVVLGNPPWVSARVSAAAGNVRDDLRDRFRSARGAYDLAAAFVERSLELLAPGGQLAFVLPGALLSARHGRVLREMLTGEATLTDLVDARGSASFQGIDVYPVLLGATRWPPWPAARVALDAARTASLPHDLFAATAAQGFPLGVCPDEALALESRARAGVPLAAIAEVFGMTAGFDAARTAAALCERPEATEPAVPFVTSASVRPFELRHGDVRYQRRLWRDPVLLDRDERRRRRDRREKILVAGMGLRLRAAWCPEATAAGVGVFGVVPRAGVDPFLLLGCLNASGASRDYAWRFPGKRMSGGYLAVNRHTLEAVPVVAATDPRAPAIAAAARTLHGSGGADERAWRDLDQLVEEALS